MNQQINSYYKGVFSRTSKLKEGVLNFFKEHSSWYRILLEVFIRKDFGERYFKISAAITATIFFMLVPVFFRVISVWLPMAFGGDRFVDLETSFWTKYALYYIFLVVSLVYGFKRNKEIKKSRSVFDFEKFSKSSGTINPIFYRENPLKIDPNIRNIETILEPLVFFIPGVLLWLIGQKLGVLLVISSLFYSFSYLDMYRSADNWMLNIIDKIILAKSTKKALKSGNWNDNQGVQFRHRKPASQEDADDLYAAIFPEKEYSEEAV